MRSMRAVLLRDLRLAARQGGATMLVVVFFLIVVALFPLGVGPEQGVLRRIAPGVLWVAALLASLLALAKIAAHWLATGLPLVLAAPGLGVLLNLEPGAYPTLIAALALGTPILSLVGAIGAALTVGVRRGGVLLSLLVLPLYVPTLIFGVGAVEAAAADLSARPHLLFLAAGLLAALALAPWASAAALRLALE